ncbi:MAG: hypothetical protein KatS3mg105_2595 [Gemmatales bacterium]|nr:MAG: hypothetical protein KatS3mg105_2595 [Gemmatales bacterium]
MWTSFCRCEWKLGLVVVACAAALVLVSIRPTAGGWNDGSRLATVEALVDYHTLAIDRSIFVDVPPSANPYRPDEPMLRKFGTADKLFIDGHFYSDKSPVPALYLAGVYQAWQWLGGPTARHDPRSFVWLMTLCSSGLAFVVGVWCIFRIGYPLQLVPFARLGLAASFALGTVALTYSQNVNNHILLLGVASALFLSIAWYASKGPNHVSLWRVGWIGLLSGIGYSIDLGAGPVLLLAVGFWLLYRSRNLTAVVVFSLAAFPPVALHHAVNYAVGGTIIPANAVPDYFAWPGCPFNKQNMTGTWNHTMGHFVVYSLALLFGKRGFIGHNLPLFLLIPASWHFCRQRSRLAPEILCALAWCAGTWLIYAVNSTNYSGQCLTVRWFVPLLAPSFFIVAVFLQDRPEYLSDLLLLSGWGAILSALAWFHGPWIKHMVPLFWPIQAACLISWCIARRRWQQLTRSEKSQAKAGGVANPLRAA